MRRSAARRPTSAAADGARAPLRPCGGDERRRARRACRRRARAPRRAAGPRATGSATTAGDDDPLDERPVDADAAARSRRGATSATGGLPVARRGDVAYVRVAVDDRRRPVAARGPRRAAPRGRRSRCASLGAPSTTAVIPTPSRPRGRDLRPAGVVGVPGLDADEPGSCRAGRGRRRATRPPDDRSRVRRRRPRGSRVAERRRAAASSTSRALETWPGASSPCGFAKCVSREPERARLRVHQRDEPRHRAAADVAASAVAASFALGTSVAVSEVAHGEPLARRGGRSSTRRPRPPRPAP